MSSSIDVSAEVSPEEVGEERALAAIGRALAGVDRLGVAFSGGVDSSVLLAAAVRVLGPSRVVAILGVSPSLASDERAAAHEVAQVIGAALVEVATRRGQTTRPTARTGRTAASTARTSCSPGSPTRSCGARGSTRSRTGRTPTTPRAPTARAAGPRPSTGCCAPLADAGLDKAAVRALARAWDAARAPTSRPPRAWPRGSRTSPRSRPEKLRPDRPGRERRCARLGLGRLPGPPPRRHRPARAARRRPGAGRAATAARAPCREAVRAAGFRYAALDLGRHAVRARSP